MRGSLLGQLMVTMITLLLAAWPLTAGETVREVLPAQLDAKVMDVVFSGGETMHYSVHWSGGVKIGDIHLQIAKDKSQADSFIILARIKDYGPLAVFYPVDDTFSCSVTGPLKLPVLYEVHQKEGYGRDIRRTTWYDQDKRLVRYRKNTEGEQQFPVEGSVYNEFASFVITRVLKLQDDTPIVVPTFADRKRHEVQVVLVQREDKSTIFGRKNTLKVQPKMQFKGLYNKNGDTTLWLTNDQCRVPVEIRSKLVIGSMTAELVEYTNPACPELHHVQRH